MDDEEVVSDESVLLLLLLLSEFVELASVELSLSLSVDVEESVSESDEELAFSPSELSKKREYCTVSQHYLIVCKCIIV